MAVIISTALSYSFSTAVIAFANAKREWFNTPSTIFNDHTALLRSNKNCIMQAGTSPACKIFENLNYFTLALMNSTMLPVGVPGVNTSAMPAAFKPGMSASGITPPPITRTSVKPFSFSSSTTFGKRVLCAPESRLKATTLTSSCRAASAICSGVRRIPV